MYVCTYVCVNVCMYVNVMYVCMRCMYVCMHACMYVCNVCMYCMQRMYVCSAMYVMHVCMYVCIMHACMYVCMYVCMYACMHACMHVCMYACMCRQTGVFNTPLPRPRGTAWAPGGPLLATGGALTTHPSFFAWGMGGDRTSGRRSPGRRRCHCGGFISRDSTTLAPGGSCGEFNAPHGPPA